MRYLAFALIAFCAFAANADEPAPPRGCVRWHDCVFRSDISEKSATDAAPAPGAEKSATDATVTATDAATDAAQPMSEEMIAHDAMLMKRANVGTVVLPASVKAEHPCRGIFAAFGIKAVDADDASVKDALDKIPCWAAVPKVVRTDRLIRDTGEVETYLVYGFTFSPERSLVDHNRRPFSRLFAFAHDAQPFAVSRKGAGFELANRSDNLSSDDVSGFWTLLENGAEIAAGGVTMPRIAPRSTGAVTLAGLQEILPTLDASKEHIVNIMFTTKKDEPWAKVGFTVASDQILLNSPQPPATAPAAASAPAATATAAPAPASGDKAAENAQPESEGARMPETPQMFVEETPDEIIVEIAQTSAVFERRTGTVRSLVMRGTTVFDNPAPSIAAGPRLIDPFNAARPQSIKVEGNTVTITSVAEARTTGIATATHESRWTFATNGAVTVANKITTAARDIRVRHLAMTLPPWFSQMRYYGRGPGVNDSGTKEGHFVGVYAASVSDDTRQKCRDLGWETLWLAETHCDARWVEFVSRRGAGVRFTFSAPASIQATHYGLGELTFMKNASRMEAYHPPVEPRGEVVVFFTPPECSTAEWSYTIETMRR